MFGASVLDASASSPLPGASLIARRLPTWQGGGLWEHSWSVPRGVQDVPIRPTNWPMASPTQTSVPRYVVRQIAVESYTDERTVSAYLCGRMSRQMTRARIEEALRRLKMTSLLRTDA